MLITEKEILKKYSLSKSLWIGVPSIEITKGGRSFITFYTGGTKEEIGNYVLLLKSDDEKNFGEPIAVCHEEGHRCFDPCLWIDPLGRLWLTWSRYPHDGVFAAICDDPDADEIKFGEEFFIAHNIMMNKPTVLSGGEWIFPVAVWNRGVCVLPIEDDIPDEERGSFAYVTYDFGRTFKKLGKADVKKRSFDEHMFLELKNGVLRIFVRTRYGIGAADSYDGGINWGKDFDTGYGGPCSRFHIRRLPSGRVLLLNHHNYTARSHLTALLSEDDGKTFPYKLLLDERSGVSYPDAAIGPDGMINITYDRERGAMCSSLEEVKTKAREILTARISEEDIINGSPINEKSFLKHVAVKLADYDGADNNPYNEKELFSDSDYANYLRKNCGSSQDIITKLFDAYDINCANIHHLEAQKFDTLVNSYIESGKLDVLNEIIKLVRTARAQSDYTDENVVDKICAHIIDNLEKNDTVEDIARKFSYSTHYI